MKKLFIYALCLTTLGQVSLSSCNNEKVLPNNGASQITEGDKNARAIWPWLVGAVAVAYLTPKLAEGQYWSKTTTFPNGTIQKEDGCDGVGSCKISLRTRGGESISSVNPDDWSADYEVNSELKLLEDGTIIFELDPAQNSVENFNRLFYADTIKFLSPDQTYTIDDPNILRDFRLNEPLIIRGGEYIVYTRENRNKFIVLN